MKTSPTKWLNENLAHDLAQWALGIVLAAVSLQSDSRGEVGRPAPSAGDFE